MLFNEQRTKPIAQIVLWIPILYNRFDPLFETRNTTGWWVIEEEDEHCIIVYPVWLFLFIHSFIHLLVIPAHESSSNHYWIASILCPTLYHSLIIHSPSFLSHSNPSNPILINNNPFSTATWLAPNQQSTPPRHSFNKHTHQTSSLLFSPLYTVNSCVLLFMSLLFAPRLINT